MADGYGYGYGLPPSGYATGGAAFMSGMMPGLNRTMDLLAQMPMIRQQAEEMERKRALQSMQTLNEAMQLAPNLRGPYLDYIAPHLGLPDATVKMFKRMSEEQVESARRALQGLKVPPELVPSLLQEAVKNPSKLVEMYNAQTKREAQEKKDQELRDIFAGAPKPAAEPEHGQPIRPVAVPPGPAESPVDEVVRTAQDPTLGPSAAVPRLRGALRALDEAEATELERIKAQQDKLAKLHPEELKNYDAHFNSQRATVKDMFAVRRTAIQERLKKLDPEPLTDVAKDFKDLAAARARGDTTQVAALEQVIKNKSRPEITALQADTQGTVGLDPWDPLMTSEKWQEHARIKAARANEYAAAGAKATAQARLAVPERPSATEREKLIGATNTYDQTREIGGMYKPEFVGPVRGRIPANALSATGRTLPGEADFRGALSIYRNAAIHELTGTAAGVQEAARLVQQIPSETDTPENFEAKLRQTERNLYRSAMKRRRMYAGTGLDMSGIPEPVAPEGYTEPAPTARPAAPTAAPLQSAEDKLRARIRQRGQGAPVGR